MSQLRRRLPPLASLAPFEAAGRLGSFSAAAVELNLTQAAISRQISALEHSLGVRLFERKRYGVELTANGAELLKEVGSALAVLADASDRARSAAKTSKTVSIYCDVAIGGSFVIPRLGAVRRDLPDLVIRLVTSSELLETTTEPFDIGLTTGRFLSDRFEVVEICGEEVFPVASPALAHELSRRIGAMDLRVAPLLHFAQQGRDWVDWPRFLAFHGVTAPPQVEGFPFTSYSVLLDAAEAGHGIALGWKLSVDNRLRQGTLVRLEGLTMPLEKGLAAYLPRRRPRTPATDTFLHWLLTSFAERPPSPDASDAAR
ncbi:MAG: LysR substrate-binding domain-containing protein [Hyphomicrobiaceae bacterium]